MYPTSQMRTLSWMMASGGLTMVGALVMAPEVGPEVCPLTQGCLLNLHMLTFL